MLVRVKCITTSLIKKILRRTTGAKGCYFLAGFAKLSPSSSFSSVELALISRFAPAFSILRVESETQLFRVQGIYYFPRSEIYYFPRLEIYLFPRSESNLLPRNNSAMFGVST